MIAGVLVFFLYGWSSCTNRQLVVSKMKTTRMHTTIAKTSIRGFLEDVAYRPAYPASGNTSPQVKTWPEIADLAVGAFLNDEAKDPRSFPNPYNRAIPVFTQRPAGDEPGVVYIDASQSKEGKVLITGVYLDPNNLKIARWVETLKIPGPSEQPNPPQYQESSTPAAIAPPQPPPLPNSHAEGRDCSDAIPVDSLAAENTWLRNNIPGTTYQQHNITQCDQDLVDILTVRIPDGSKRMIYFKLKK